MIYAGHGRVLHFTRCLRLRRTSDTQLLFCYQLLHFCLFYLLVVEPYALILFRAY